MTFGCRRLMKIIPTTTLYEGNHERGTYTVGMEQRTNYIRSVETGTSPKGDYIVVQKLKTSFKY